MTLFEAAAADDAVLLPALQRHGRLALHEATRAKLLQVSAATIDRLLAGMRVAAAAPLAVAGLPGGAVEPAGPPGPVPPLAFDDRGAFWLRVTV